MELDFEPVHGKPALVISGGKKGGNAVVLADIHLGYEHELRKRGIRIPPQAEKTIESVLSICAAAKAKRLIVIGDVKHMLPKVAVEETVDVRYFFRRLLSSVKRIDVAPGNHDGEIARFDEPGLFIHPASGFTMGEFGFAHGHAWPSKEVMASRFVFLGHNHPSVSFFDKDGNARNAQCWVRANVYKTRISERYKGANPELIIMPSFSSFGSGTTVNSQRSSFLGPLLSSNLIKKQSAKVYLLDGVYLGTIKELARRGSL